MLAATLRDCNFHLDLKSPRRIADGGDEKTRTETFFAWASGNAHKALNLKNLNSRYTLALASTSASPSTPVHALTPLREPLFRALWIAMVASNAGTWVQEVGAAWLMTSLDPSALMVALVRTASALPMFLLALPAGAAADVFDRRRLLLIALVWMAIVAAVLAAMTIAGLVTPGVLLALTGALAIGTALFAPTWQATIAELVPRAQLPAAIALNSVSLNLARSIGPALGGLVVAAAGPGATFALNAVSFCGMIAVLYRWKRPPLRSMLPTERILGAMRTGLRYVRHAPLLQIALAREFSFIIFSAAFWALLPALARFELGRGPTGYGILLGFFGGGAVLAAALQPRLRALYPVNRLINIGIIVFATALAALAWTRSFLLVEALMIIIGGAWLSLLSTFNAALQSLVSPWVRGRVLAVSILTFFGAMVAGSALWGYTATHIGIPWTLSAAAFGALGVLAFAHRYALQTGEHLDLSPSAHRPAPQAAESTDPEHGPVVITIEYRIDPARRAEFEHTMSKVRRIRRRNGAVSWGLLRDVTDPKRVTEAFVAESWVEHLRQHERVTVADREILDLAHDFHAGPGSPRVTHYLMESLADA